MKIDESSIKHNAVDLITDENRSLTDYDEKDMIAVSGYIAGVIAMAERMKEVLKS